MPTRTAIKLRGSLRTSIGMCVGERIVFDQERRAYTWVDAREIQPESCRESVCSLPLRVFLPVSASPLYCSDHGFDCGDNAKHLRKQLESVLYGNKVDLVLTGHQHDYERVCIL
jgi:hypothetical protein